jgi:hypothetical protein
MRSFVRPLIALFAAYGLVLSIFLGSISASLAVRSSAGLCISSASVGGGDSPPIKQKPHALACLVSCGLAMAGFFPLVSAAKQQLVSLQISWRLQRKNLRQSDTFGALSARGPPAHV